MSIAIDHKHWLSDANSGVQHCNLSIMRINFCVSFQEELMHFVADYVVPREITLHHGTWFVSDVLSTSTITIVNYISNAILTL